MSSKLKIATTGFILTILTIRAFAASIAVVPVGLEANKYGDTLTVQLSKLPAVTLLERAQIDKLLSEQALAATQQRDFIKLGRTLNAEGVVVLERRIGPGTNDILAVRVIAVRPGVIITENHFPLPMAEPLKWAESYSTQFERLLPRLAVSAAEAVAVSVGSLRSSLSTGDAGSLEQELTALLRLRLAHEPSVFLLERRNMEALQNEKDLAAADEPFWNGAFIIDGTINRDIVSQSNVTIDARVAAPNVPAIQVRVDGRKESLPELANRLVTNILARIGKIPAPTTWRTQAEAEKFFEEAQWAARWGLWQQTREAADASWSLGKQTPTVAAYRLAARASLILSMHGYLGWEPADEYGFNAPPKPEALPLLTHTLEIYRDLFARFTSSTNATRIGWGSLGLDTLLLSSDVLSWFQHRVEYREGNDEQLRRVREATREINQMLLTNQGFGLHAWKRDLQGLVTLYNPRETSLAEIWIKTGCIWSESPRDAVAYYRQILKFVEVRSVHARPVKPSEAAASMVILDIVVRSRQALIGSKIPLHAWSIRDRETLPTLRSEFLQEIATSTNLPIRFDGLRAILATSENPDILVSAAEQLVNEVASNRLVIFQQSLIVPQTEVLTDLLRRIEPWGVPQSARLEQLRETYTQNLLKGEDPEFVYEVWKDFLRKLANTNEQVLSFRQPSTAPTPERARELVSEIERLKPELRKRWGIEQHLLGLKAVAASESQRKEPVRQPNEVASVAATSAPPSLTISRVWRKDEQRLPPGRTFPDRWVPGKMFWQDGHLWMDRYTYGVEFQGSHPRQALLKFEMAMMRAEVIEAPFESLKTDFSQGITIQNKEIFLKLPGVIWRIDSSGAWKKHPISMDGRPVAWNKSIVLTGPESITQFFPESGELRLLASTRRNPPVSALDRLNLNDAVVAVWSDNSLYATASGSLWKFDPKQNDWHRLIVATNCGESLQLEAQGVLYRRSGECGGPNLLGGLRPGVVDLEYYTWESGRPLRSGTAGGQLRDAFTPPIWNSPQQSVIGNRAAQFDGSSVWIFPVRFNRFNQRELSPPTLLFLDPRLDQALEIGIDFAPALAEEGKAYESARISVYESSGASFLATPEGLAIYIAETEMLLWAPKADVDAALAKARQRQNARESSYAVALTRFDRNSDGWLDNAERQGMRRDAAWQRELSAQIDSARAKALKEHGAEWDTLFDAADMNHDRMLSTYEFNRIVIGQPSSFIQKVRGHNGQAFLLTRPYDLNNDSALNRDEFKEFMADPRFPAEVLRSASWVTKFGLKVEACDTNDDGILDTAERTQTYRLIRQKLGQSGRESN